MNRHDPQGALAEYRRKIDDGTATWHDYHQLGVALSTLAEQVWLLQDGFWQAQATLYLAEAMSFLFQAAEMVKGNFGIDRAAVNCDWALVLARTTRVQPDRKKAHEYLIDAKTLLTRVALQLEEDYTVTQDRAIIHQKAIAHGFLARLAFGNSLDFGHEEPEWHDIRHNVELAMGLFDTEGDQRDHKRAFRSFLLWTALGYNAANRPANRKQLAGQAGWSALRHGDYKHLLRALAIYWRGADGERWLLRRQSR